MALSSGSSLSNDRIADMFDIKRGLECACLSTQERHHTSRHQRYLSIPVPTTIVCCTLNASPTSRQHSHHLGTKPCPPLRLWRLRPPPLRLLQTHNIRRHTILDGTRSDLQRAAIRYESRYLEFRDHSPRDGAWGTTVEWAERAECF
jgi:hypothetical protein